MNLQTCELFKLIKIMKNNLYKLISTLLLAAGVGYGAKKVRDLNKLKNKNNDTTVE